MLKEFAFANSSGVFYRTNQLVDEKSIFDFLAEHKDDACYATFMSYDVPEIATARLSAPLVFDFDSHAEIDAAKSEAQVVIDFFKETTGIEPAIYFSGGKGFHLSIPFSCLGVEPSYHLVSVFKAIATQIKQVKKLKTLDTKIYERRRLFRIVNTKHLETGLYKVQLTKDEIKLSVDEIKNLAKEPRKTFKVQQEVNEKLKEAFLRAEKQYLDSLEKKYEREFVPANVMQDLPCIKKLLQGAEEGERNESCYTLALYFKRQEVSESDAIKKLTGYSGLPDNEVRATVSSAYHSQFIFGCNDNEVLQKHCDKSHCPFGFMRKTINELVWDKEGLIAELGKEKDGEFITNLTFGLDEMDEEWNGIRKDELIICAADAGVGKSAYAIWMAMQNTAKGSRVLFCSLEMATHSLLARTCRETGGDFGKMEKWIREEPIYFYRDGQPLSTKNLRRNLEESIKQGFGVDLIVIDHLGYLEKTSDKIYESVTAIAEELSTFCKDLNIPVMLLTHYNKGQAGASNKPRSVNDLLGSGRLRDFASKIIQIWYPKDDESCTNGETLFILQKNRYGNTKMIKLKYVKGKYLSLRKKFNILDTVRQAGLNI